MMSFVEVNAKEMRREIASLLNHIFLFVLVLLTLRKLRLASTNADLGQRFGIACNTVSVIFNTLVKRLASAVSYTHLTLPTKLEV